MKNSAIQWTDHTFNPWIGCSHAKTEAGKPILECLLCYAETLDDQRFSKTLGAATKEFPISHWGRGAPRHRTSDDYWKQPLRWNEKPMVCGGCGKSFNYGYEVGQGCPGFCGGVLHRARVFCLSLGDWLDEEVPIEWFVNLLEVIHATPNLDWQLLTKRPQNWQQRTSDAFQFAMDNGADHGRQMDFTDWLGAWTHAHIAPDNTWIGVSAGADQKASLEIPAKVHFLSCEPMLHVLDTTHAAEFDQIIFGGESGKNARRFVVDWLRAGKHFCRAHGIKLFVKQMGRYVVDRNDAGYEGDPGEWPMDTQFEEIDTGYQGAPVRVWLRDSHGGDVREWPEDLRVREFPGIGENAERRTPNVERRMDEATT